jgi:hypothetical protein
MVLAHRRSQNVLEQLHRIHGKFQSDIWLGQLQMHPSETGHGSSHIDMAK